MIRGTQVRASLTRVGLQLVAVQGPLLPCIGRAVLGLREPSSNRSLDKHTLSAGLTLNYKDTADVPRG